jgi:hypothetical protein
MRRLLAASLLIAALASPIAGCGGNDDDKDAATTPTPTNTPATPAPTAAPDSASQLPPAFLQCMADQGFTVTSTDDIHSAPPDVLQACFGTLHGGGR